MKNIIFLLVSLALFSCSSDDSSNQSGSATCGQIDQGNDIVVATNGVTSFITINQTRNVAITASGVSVTVTEGSPIGNLYVGGFNNQIKFEANVTVEYVCMSGSDNILLIPTGTTVTINNDTGSGNLVVVY